MSYGFNQIVIKTLMEVLMEFDKLILKFMWKSKGLRREKIMLNKKDKVGRMAL